MILPLQILLVVEQTPNETGFSLDWSDFIIAVIAALLAVLFGKGMTIYDNHIRYANIRKMIVSDLKLQLQAFQFFIRDIDRINEVFLYYSKDEEEKVNNTNVHFGINNSFQIDTFTSQTRLDFFKSFHEYDFQTLMIIYENIKNFIPVRFSNIKKGLEDKLTDIKEKAINYEKEHHENKDALIRIEKERFIAKERACIAAINEMKGYKEGAIYSIELINKLIRNSEENYKTFMLADIFPLYTFLPIFTFIVSVVALIASILAVAITLLSTLK